MLWASVKEGMPTILEKDENIFDRQNTSTPNRKFLVREDSIGSLDVSSFSSESCDSSPTLPNPNRRGSQISDVFRYLDEDAQDAVFYADEDENSNFESVSHLTSKLEKEIVRLFQCHYHCPTVLIGLSETTSRVANQLIQMSDNEPYGVKGARVILKFKTSNGEEQSIGSFSLDPDTISTFEITLYLQQGQPFGSSLRSWFGQITNGTKSIHIGPHYSLKKVDLYTHAKECVVFDSTSLSSSPSSF